MRLWFKIVLAMSLAIAILALVAGLSLVAIQRLVEVNRAITTLTAPALRLEESLRETVLSLNRLGARWAVLQDSEYAWLFARRAEAASRELARLGELMKTPPERALHRKLVSALATYQRVATMPVEGRGTAEAAQLQTRVTAERLERTLPRLIEATYDSFERSEVLARKLEDQTWHAVLLALPLSGLAALLGAGVLGYRMTHALERLSVATTEIAEGAFTRRVEVETRDEIGQLARAFNRMVERLSEVDRLKQEFFSHISHELRTPLTAVLESVNLLRDRVPGPLEPRQARLVEIIGSSTDRVLRLVNRILELARLQAGLLPIDRRPVDLEGLTARALHELRPQAETRGLTLEHNGHGQGLVVEGDADRLLEVLVNLIGNAVKFTPAGGTVGVALADRGDAVEITVDDTGAGLPPDAIARIFEPYWQAPGARGGTGLGLAIVKGIVEAHGGRVTAEGRPGKGSRFTVCLPRSVALRV